MVDKLSGRFLGVLDTLREGRHAPARPAPPPPPAPEPEPLPRPCVICESTLTAARVRRFPRALTCSTDCSIEHQVRLNRVITRKAQRRRRARRKETADAARGIGGEAGPADGGTALRTRIVEMGTDVVGLEQVGDFVYGLTGSTDWRCQNAGSL